METSEMEKEVKEVSTKLISQMGEFTQKLRENHIPLGGSINDERFKLGVKMLLNLHESTSFVDNWKPDWIYNVRQCALDLLMHDPNYHKKNGSFNVSKIVKKLGIDRRTANVWIKNWLKYNNPITMQWKTNEEFEKEGEQNGE